MKILLLLSLAALFAGCLSGCVGSIEFDDKGKVRKVSASVNASDFKEIINSRR